MFAAARMWSVSHKHGYATAADFVRGRYGSAVLALLVAITGIVATMPYIASAAPRFPGGSTGHWRGIGRAL